MIRQVILLGEGLNQNDLQDNFFFIKTIQIFNSFYLLEFYKIST